MFRILQWYHFASAMGMRYATFRIIYEAKRRIGLMKKDYPTSPPFKVWITLAQWRRQAPAFFFSSRRELPLAPQATEELKITAGKILQGEIQFFQGDWHKIAEDDWLTNIATGHEYDNQKHWTEIPDFDPALGDIKFVWERSRFTFLQTILRYDACFESDSSEWVFRQIDSWIEHNPLNQGPNYRCSQETSLRVFNWILALYFYREAACLTEERFQKIIFSIYWQVRHVRSNINFSRIAVRNNHAITETLALYTAGLLFPFFAEADEWRNLGKKWLEEEIAYQIAADGTYLQYSFNYHRVVIQLLTWAVALAHRHRDEFSRTVYERAFASVRVLMHCQDFVSGGLPNYGLNDGSLFFQWNDQGFHDYRPALDCLHFALTGKNAYHQVYYDRAWFGLHSPLKNFEPVAVQDGVHSFSDGGMYVYRNRDLMVWINCVDYKHRPHQADTLHLDVWNNGENLLCDAGSYLYNTSPNHIKYFFGTESHNTMMIENQDQMVKGSRFIWLKWSQRIEAKWTLSGDSVCFEGKAKVFQQLGKVMHTRKVVIDPAKRQLVVTDHIEGAGDKVKRQLWHLNPSLKDKVSFTATATSGILRKDSAKFNSPTYGVLSEALQIEFETKEVTISTQITWV